MRTAPCTVLCVCLLPAVAGADIPKMGGEMNHVLVSVYQQEVYVTVERPDEMPLTLYNYQEHYTGPASVLNHLGYNAQYGWLAGGFISLPPDASMWIELIDQTPGLRSFEQGSFAPIFGTSGSPARWEWDGTMTHNWYAAMMLGDYAAEYRVFVGTADGGLYDGFTPGSVTLSWSYLSGGIDGRGSSRRDAVSVWQIPSPGASLLLIAALGARRRRSD